MKSRAKISVFIIGVMLIASFPIRAMGLERDNDTEFYFPDLATYNASTPGSSYVELTGGSLQEMEIYNADDLNSDGLDGSLDVKVSTELDLTVFSNRYQPNDADSVFNTGQNVVSADSDATITQATEVLNDVTVQQKYRIFDPGNVVRVEVLLTASTDTTRKIRLEGNFGSDEDTVLMAQRSSGSTSVGDWGGGITEIDDALMTAATQWFVSSEDSAVNSDSADPVMGTVLRGPVSSVAYEWVNIPGTVNDEDNWGVNYTVVLPANQTVSLVLFHRAMAHDGDLSNANFGTFTSLMDSFNTYSGSYFANLTSNVPVLNWGDTPTNRTVFYPLDEIKVKKVAPSQPATPSVRPVGRSSINVKLNRPASIGTGTITKYNIFRNGKLIASVPASASSYVDRNLERGNSYSYQIQAVSTDGTSLKSKTSNSIYRR